MHKKQAADETEKSDSKLKFVKQSWGMRDGRVVELLTWTWEARVQIPVGTVADCDIYGICEYS